MNGIAFRSFRVLFFILCVILAGCNPLFIPIQPTQPSPLTPTQSQPTIIQNTPTIVQCGQASIANPAAVYCNIVMGYKYEIVNNPSGQSGQCLFPNGDACDEWDFLTGKCGQNFSYCAKQGYGIKTVNDGKNPFSSEYAVCTSSDGKIIGSATDLSGLTEKLLGCKTK